MGFVLALLITVTIAAVNWCKEEKFCRERDKRNPWHPGMSIEEMDAWLQREHDYMWEEIKRKNK